MHRHRLLTPVEREWVRTLGLVYCPHVRTHFFYTFCAKNVQVMTTVVPILAEILTAKNSDYNKAVLFSVYVPYFIVPAILLWQLLIHDPLFPKEKRN